MIQVINEKITKYSLPKVGTLSTGETVSGYHLLPIETLETEGWLPLEDVQPEYDSETHYLRFDGYDIQTDKVIKLYKIEPIPEPEPDRLEALEAIVAALLGEE